MGNCEWAIGKAQESRNKNQETRIKKQESRANTPIRQRLKTKD